MKLQHVALVVLSLASTSAFASKARLQALGQDENGSYYIKDTRNIFLNPAAIVDTANFANFEWGTTTRPAGATPNAEGGFVHSMGDLKYGVQLGRESEMADNVENALGFADPAGAPTSITAPNDTVEILVGGNAGMKWGASFLYQRSKESPGTAAPATPKLDSSGYEIAAGVAQDAFDAHARLNLMNKAEADFGAGASEELEGTFGLTAGGSYRLSEDQTVFAELVWDDYEASSTPAAYKYDVTEQSLGVGYARTFAKDANTYFFYSAGFFWGKEEAKQTEGAGSKSKTDSWFIPVTLGVEAEATSWMTLRGSVTQNVLISQIKVGDDKFENTPNSTTVAAGAGFKFNAITLDATFKGVSTGSIDAVNLFGNVGMTYAF